MGIVTLVCAEALTQPSWCQEPARTQERSPGDSFEVASVKANKSGRDGFDWTDRGGNINIVNITLAGLIEWAYNTKEYRISGPEWLKSERFDVSAKAGLRVEREELRRMMQSLLAERFKLTLHPEQKSLHVYELVVTKNGPKLNARGTGGHHSMKSRSGYISTDNATMDQLADVLSRYSDRPVLNKTGLIGGFKFELQWAPDERQPKPSEGGDGNTSVSSGPSIFTAVQEQLGLKLVPQKAPVAVLVIDHVEKKPIEN